MGALGDVSTVNMLVQTAITSTGAEQKTAQESLYRLEGVDVDRNILQRIAQAEPNAKVELIRACDQRNMSAAVPELLKAVKDTDGQVRIEAIKALRNLAGAGDMAALVELQMAAGGWQRSELERTVVAVARRIPADKNPAEKVLAALPAAKDVDTRCSLLSVLGRIGDPAALPVLLGAVEDKENKVKDAAVRALSDWPTAAPADDLLKIAQTSKNPVQKTLALRGYIRLVGLESDRPVEETIKMYQQAMSLAPGAGEKRMVLSGLANIKSLEALQMAAIYLADNELKQEAEAAVVKIAESTIRKNPQETKELLQKVLTGTTNELVREQAQKLLNQGK
jgi:HEAT repeat protein